MKLDPINPAPPVTTIALSMFEEPATRAGSSIVIKKAGLSEGFCGAWTRTHQSKLNFLDFGRDSIPLIKLSDSLACTKAGILANFWSLDQQPQHAFEVLDVSGNESESSISNHFAIFGDVAGQSAKSCAHRLQQCQGEPLQIGRQHKEHRVSKKIVQCFAGHPVDKSNSVALVTM